jgi:hypothetical protein
MDANSRSEDVFSCVLKRHLADRGVSTGTVLELAAEDGYSTEEWLRYGFSPQKASISATRD